MVRRGARKWARLRRSNRTRGRASKEAMVRLDEGGRAAQDVRLIAPAPSLRPWVRHVSIQPGPARHPPWRVVPDTSAHVIFSLVHGTPRCRIVGARSTYADIDVADRAFTVAVRLQPGALPALVRDRASALTDRAVDIVDVMGSRAPCAADLADMAPVEAGRALLRAIERRCAETPPPFAATALAHVSRVDDLAQAWGLSARRAHARIVDTVGLSPKRALRIRRLHATLRSVGAGQSLAAAAMLAGYSDQAHFTRDARDLLGEPPGTWFRRADFFKPVR